MRSTHNIIVRVLGVLTALAFLMSSCVQNDEHDPSDGEITHPLGTALTDDGNFTVTIDHTPETPVTGENAAVLIIESADYDVEGLTISAEPWMPGHGHGSSTTPTVTDEGGGHYRIENIVYTMPGLWQLRLTIAREDAADGIIFEYDVQ